MAISMSEEANNNAWNTGVKSPIPCEYMHLSSCLRPENVFTNIDDAFEFSKLTGLKPEHVVACRPERLVAHEVFIRVMADINIQEGRDYQDLGVRYRATVQTLMDKYITPHMGEFSDKYESVRAGISNEVGDILDSTIFKKADIEPENKKSGLSALFSFFQKNSKNTNMPNLSVEEEHSHFSQGFHDKAKSADTRQTQAVNKCLSKITNTLIVKHGRVLIDRDLLETVVTNMACNDYGSKALGDIIDPYIKDAMKVEGYRTIPVSDDPVVISLKGASAAGKSTLRQKLKTTPTPYLKELGFDGTDDFALISPDICRKSLIDYDGLGDARKYAGPLTGEELVLIDMKLDRYMKDKLDANPDSSMSHLLIDRFRFDSFETQNLEGLGNYPYISKAKELFMFFVITAPEELVERGWERGEETGRYRSADDFLALGVDAYRGMQNKFFHWKDREGPEFKYEFLNNNVPKGNDPETVAYGTYEEMNILDVSSLMDIRRYQKVNIKAKSPDDVYPQGDKMLPENNMDFILQCIKDIPTINFIDPQTHITYAQVNSGEPAILDADLFHEKMDAPEYRAIFDDVGFARVSGYLRTPSLDM